MSHFITDHLESRFGHKTEQRYRNDVAENHNRLFDLHVALYERFRMSDWDLHPHWNKNNIIADSSATSFGPASEIMTVAYFRSLNQAQRVESLMGIEANNCHSAGEPFRHPVIELRLAPDHLAVELVLSPHAWWDQQNLVGKLELGHHREALHSYIQQMQGDYCFGFWDGTYLSDMHLTTWQLGHSRVFDEWMNTFAEGQDWLRFGAWYDLDDPALDPMQIVSELQRRFGELYGLYDFVLWSSNNNFMPFYEKRQKALRRYA